MEVINRVTPSEEQMKGFMEPGREGPIYMLNLLKFKAKAEYADGRETDLSGAEAYAILPTASMKRSCASSSLISGAVACSAILFLAI